MTRYTKALFITLILLAPLASAKESYGEYKAMVIRVLDGDTIELDVQIWPQLIQRTKLRLDGINTPEKRGRGVKECEKQAAQKATNFTQQWLKDSAFVTVSHVKLGKYAGRVLGRISINGEYLGEALIKAGHTRPYDGGKREAWC